MNGLRDRLGFAPPAGTTDCHAHVFDPERFPYAANRRYTPPAATISDLIAMHDALGIERVVLVQPSVYGTDNRCLVAALEHLGDRARGVAVIDDHASGPELQALHRAGVRGARLNLQVARLADPEAANERIAALQRQLDGLPWVIQIYASLPTLISASKVLATLSQRVLIDHFGMAMAAEGLEQPGLRELLDLAACPNIFVKLSGPYQVSTRPPGYADVEPLARLLVERAPDRVIWGSDWPHPQGAQRPANAKVTDIEPFRNEDDVRTFGLVADWCPDARGRSQLLVHNPSSLFGFDE